MTELLSLSAVELATAIKEGRTTAVEAMEAYRLDMISDYVGGPGCSGHK